MRKLLAILAVAAVVIVPVAGQSPADYEALKKEIELLRQQVAMMRVEINQLRAQRPMGTAPMVPPITPQQAPGKPAAAPAPAAPIADVQNIILNLAKAPIRGAESATLTLVEVSDFECPFCARYSNNTSGQIVRDYVQTGKIRYAFVHLPIASHRNAFKAAEASMCAGDQGKFWEMHDRMFANQSALARPQLPGLAAGLGLRVDAFNACLDSSRHAAQVQADVQMVQRYGARATPTFYIGTIDPKTRTFTAAKRIVGSKTYAIFQQALNSML